MNSLLKISAVLEALGNDIFVRYFGTTVEDIITKSMHYIRKSNVSALPKIEA